MGPKKKLYFLTIDNETKRKSILKKDEEMDEIKSDCEI